MVSRCRALGRKARGLDLDAGAQFHHLEHFAQRPHFLRLDAERAVGAVGDEGADALARHDQAFGAQRRDRLAHDGAADAECGDHFLLGRQPRRPAAACRS